MSQIGEISDFDIDHRQVVEMFNQHNGKSIQSFIFIFTRATLC